METKEIKIIENIKGAISLARKETTQDSYVGKEFILSKQFGLDKNQSRYSLVGLNYKDLFDLKELIINALDDITNE